MYFPIEPPDNVFVLEYSSFDSAISLEAFLGTDGVFPFDADSFAIPAFGGNPIVDTDVEKVRLVMPPRTPIAIPPVWSYSTRVSHDFSILPEYGKSVAYHDGSKFLTTVPAHEHCTITWEMIAIGISEAIGRFTIGLVGDAPKKQDNRLTISNGSSASASPSITGNASTSASVRVGFDKIYSNRLNWSTKEDFRANTLAFFNRYLSNNYSAWVLPTQWLYGLFSFDIGEYPLRLLNGNRNITFATAQQNGDFASRVCDVARTYQRNETTMTATCVEDAVFNGSQFVRGTEDRSVEMAELIRRCDVVTYFGFCVAKYKSIKIKPRGNIVLEPTTWSSAPLRGKNVRVKLEIYESIEPASRETIDNSPDTYIAKVSPTFSLQRMNPNAINGAVEPIATRVLALSNREYNQKESIKLDIVDVEPIELLPRHIYAFRVSLEVEKVTVVEENIRDTGVSAGGQDLFSGNIKYYNGYYMEIGSSSSIEWDIVEL